jgi:hypothetical protein
MSNKEFRMTKLTASCEIVTPVKTGVQIFFKRLSNLDSGFRRNDERPPPRTCTKVPRLLVSSFAFGVRDSLFDILRFAF